MTNEPSTSHKSSDDVDINDAFDAILLAEERLAEEGYERGFAQGEREGNVDAYHFGYHRGAEVGAELGFYYGVICGVELSLGEEGGPSKGEALLKELKKEIEDFPRFNDLEVDLVEGLVKIRGKYRKLCAVLKISAKVFGMDLIRGHLETLVEVLRPQMAFLNCHMVDYLTEGHWDRYVPEEVREELTGKQKMAESKEVFWNQFNEEFKSSKFPKLTKHIESMKHFRLDSLPDACLTTEQLNSAFDLCLKETRLKMPELMSIKKCHEVEVASAVVASLCAVVATKTGDGSKTLDQVTVIDAGDGKGYLSSRIALEHGIKVLGIDCNEGNTINAERRRDQLLKKVPVALKRSKLSEESLPNNPPESPLYKTTTRLIDFNTNLITLVQEQFPESPTSAFTLAGLHTCGNLGPNSLRLFHQNPHIRALCNVGCCYHLLIERFVQDEFYNKNRIKDNPGIGFPMSNFMTEKGFALGRNARNLAAESIERSAMNRENPSDKLGYRALLQIVLKELDVKVDRQVGKLNKVDCFVDYVRKSLKRLNVDGGDLVTDEYLVGLEKKYELELEQLKVFYLYRMTYAPIVEGLILLDRLLYLKECGYENSYLVKLFDPVVSPRCYSIVAFI